MHIQEMLDHMVQNLSLEQDLKTNLELHQKQINQKPVSNMQI